MFSQLLTDSEELALVIHNLSPLVEDGSALIQISGQGQLL